VDHLPRGRRATFRLLTRAVCTVPLLAGCGLSSPWGSSGTSTVAGDSQAVAAVGGTTTTTAVQSGFIGPVAPSGSHDTIVATPSVAGPVAVALGANQTVSITFTSSDGLDISDLALSGTSLAPGWSGPTAFSCALVRAGSDCVLNLTYAPSAPGSGVITLDYLYIDDAGLRRTPGGSLSIPFIATLADNVVAAANPTGQVSAAVGRGSQAVVVNFTSDDGQVATDLTLLTNLGALPPGWSAGETGLACAIVSTGSGCQLALAYAPTAPASGTLTLSYDYTDDSGAGRSGALNIPYATTAANNVVATVAPAAQVTAIENTGGQPVVISFFTDDGKPATNLYAITDVGALPAGWSSTAKAFFCSSVAAGGGCRLELNYAPSALASGTLVMNFAYDDGAGTFRLGTVDIPYAATTNDNVAAAVSPSGRIDAIVGDGAETVAVTFATDDGRLATALTLAGGMAALPAGWQITTPGFACSGVGAGTACQLILNYAPAAAASGLLALHYAYFNNAGLAGNGTVNIPYRATTDDRVVATANPGGLSVTTGGSATLTLTFTTDDGNPASDLSVTPGLGALPLAWTGPSGPFGCAFVSAVNGCQLTLTYAPVAAAAGTLTFGFGYTNDAGIARTGTVAVAYAAVAPL